MNLTYQTAICVAVLFLSFAWNANGDALMGKSGCHAEACLTVLDVSLNCSDFAAAQDTLGQAFLEIRAENKAGDDRRAFVRVVRMTRVNTRNRYEYIDLEEAAMASGYFQADEYDYTIGKTQKLFACYFLFKPGVYEIYYQVLDDNGVPVNAFEAEATQIIRISEDCGGPLGSLSQDGCAGCREKYIPEGIDALKRWSGDWLLLGAALLVLPRFSRRQ